MDGLLTQGGHLTDLTVDRYLDVDLSDDERAAVEGHLEACDPCVELVEEVRRWGDGLNVTIPQFSAPSSPAKVLPFRPRSFSTGVGAALAIAAATLVVVALPSAPSPELPPDTFTLKGPAVAWELHVHDGQASRVVEPGDEVEPNHRVGFRVQSRRAGYLAIFGADDHGESYVAFPQDDSGRAAAWGASDVMLDVPAAIAFDAKPGREWLKVVFCAEPFALSEMQPTLPTVRVPDVEGCTTKVRVLRKRW